jgi:hypothetical protein
MNTTIKTKPLIFPKLDLEMVLRDELIMAAEVEAALHGKSLPMSGAAAAVARVPMDSLVVVELLCAVEPVLGFIPRDSTVQTGGYNSVQEAMDHLMPRLERQWIKSQGAPK